MNQEKPNKKIYQNQKEIHNLIIKQLKMGLLKKISKADLIGSLAQDSVGIEESEYEGYLGSDIDLVVLTNKDIPKSWKYEGDFYDWHKKYNAGVIVFKGIKHPITILIPFKQDMSLFWKKAKELNWCVERFK